MNDEMKTEQALGESRPNRLEFENIEHEVVLTVVPKIVRKLRARFVFVPRGPEELTINDSDIVGIGTSSFDLTECA
jgi:hypothetical protein